MITGRLGHNRTGQSRPAHADPFSPSEVADPSRDRQAAIVTASHRARPVGVGPILSTPPFHLEPVKRYDEPMKKKEASKETRQHDPVYRRIFNRAQIIEEILRRFATGPWAARLDFSTLAPVPADFIAKYLKSPRGAKCLALASSFSLLKPPIRASASEAKPR